VPVAIGVYDVAGRLVRQLIDAPVEAGHHALVWDGRGRNGTVLGSGIYFVRVEIGNHAFNQKVTLIK
jgi:flagellar hook assembly protein FlgD